MTKIITALAMLLLIAAMPLRQAAAQGGPDNTLGGAIIGGGIGAIIGGAATGKAGGAVAGGIIGAAAGAMLGSQLEPRGPGYFWYDGRCWQRWGDGSYHRVPQRYCY
jgi:hypothetical protein